MVKNPTARLFVAVDPPGDVREQLADWARSATRAQDAQVRGKTSLRLLDPELLHVTLCFLGNRPAGEIDSLGARLAACGGPPGKLSLGAPLWLPARRPRALAVELHKDSGELARLQADVLAAIEQLSDWRSDLEAQGGAPTTHARRRFHPHITVARMGRGTTPHGSVLPPTPSLSFVPRELVLYRSWLSPAGASYEALASYPID